ncbi:hypothetical protein [Sphingomonas oryzagri]|uniref:XRE family transcriptional regulator n=1 Tax=Sphingomonas oryzagri TaxID=3042314 RepID=A0ABT6N5Z8_9SPHN|nr:hypothetical protein [Sphingomonas oryzagri]MDH7640544.1 hypothetical protein [Sphingomonas oryzagri]
MIHGNFRTPSASILLETIGVSLGRLKDRDRLTYADVGRVLGKGEDTAAKYRDATAEMGVVSFILGCREWNGAFANDVMSLVGMRVVPIDSSDATDRDALPAITGLLHEVALAFADDGKIDDEEIVEMRNEIEAAGHVIDMMRMRLKALTEVAP